MKLIDTVAIIGFLNPKDKVHKLSVEHIDKIASDDDTFVPMISLVEADLVMKIRRYNYSEREISWHALESRIPRVKIIPNSVTSIHSALELQRRGMDYFDSLVASLAEETSSIVITNDRAIGDVVRTEW
jgi:predicted nucleic-acid-binding protein